mmetsp:Transcript_38916/g.81791  ORF Transcript_38916/g.81791 Transcript_38916/m.81791 type:complete len:594 (-) Transcript_38916:288-2069(-)
MTLQMNPHPYHHDANPDENSTLGSNSYTGNDGNGGNGSGNNVADVVGNDGVLLDDLLGGNDASLTSRAPSYLPGSGNALPRVVTAADELESLCRAEISGGGAAARRDGSNGNGNAAAQTKGFPPTCMLIIGLLAGNHCCVDCGDEDRGNLQYASVGYGTLLCRECAHRHITVGSMDESIVKHLSDDHWNLRSTLALLEGSNTKMLDYVKHKPRWRPPKNTKHTITEDALAFKQIYLSKAAGAYRASLGRKVDDVFYSRITSMRERDAAKEEKLQEYHARVSNSIPPNPFANIFEQNNVSPEDFPGFLDAPDIGIKIASKMGGGGGDAALGVGVTRGRSKAATNPLMRREAPSVDLIKARIERRRSRNSSILTSGTNDGDITLPEPFFSTGETSINDGDNAATNNNSMLMTASAVKNNMMYNPASSRKARTTSNATRQKSRVGLVGEVGDTSIMENDDRSSVAAGSMYSRRRPSKSDRSYGADQLALYPALSYESRHDPHAGAGGSIYGGRGALVSQAPLGQYTQRRRSSTTTTSNGSVSNGGNQPKHGGQLVQRRRTNSAKANGEMVIHQSGTNINGSQMITRRPMYHPPKTQ